MYQNTTLTKRKTILDIAINMFCRPFTSVLVFLFALVLASVGYANAQTTPESIFSDSPTFLKVDEAFGFDFEQRGDKLIIKWDIADGYYLYKKQFKTATKNVTLGEPRFPESVQIEDEFFGLSDVFFEDMEFEYPIIKAKQDGSVKLRFQGCAKAGLCYPPTTKVIFLEAYDSGLLTPEQAFTTQVSQQDNTIVIDISSKDTYFVLADSIKVNAFAHELGEQVTEHSNAAISEDTVSINGIDTAVFAKQTRLEYPILSFDAESGAPPVIEVSLQGCTATGAGQVLCYQEITTGVNLDEDQSTANSAGLADNSNIEGTAPQSEQFALADMLSNENIWISLGVLTLLGLGLAFTPCVYPMYPILSSIVIGKGKKQIKTSHAFTLSFVYVQGMAITYSIIGLIVAYAGVQFQAALQHPVLLSVFIVLFVVLALGMFGLYEIQLPAKWQNKLNNLSNDQEQGNYLGVFVMGIVSGLVASPCTTAPLTAILIVIANSDSLVFGFFALYALSIGMGIPLILFGITGGKLLPKAGAWMNVVKVTFGFMMLTVAILFVERFIVSEWTDLLWAILGLSLFSYWYTVNQNTNITFVKGIRTLVSIGGLVLSVIFTLQTLQKLDLIPPLLGNANQSSYSASQDTKGHPEFTVVKSLADFEEKLKSANNDGKTVMLDLYADWCVACKEFEKYTFPDAQVVDALSQTVWMQIDLTDNTPSNLEFQEAYNIVGLPTIMFFNKNGEELKRSRVTGFMKADAFAAHSRNTLPKS